LVEVHWLPLGTAGVSRSTLARRFLTSVAHPRTMAKLLEQETAWLRLILDGRGAMGQCHALLKSRDRDESSAPFVELSNNYAFRRADETVLLAFLEVASAASESPLARGGNGRLGLEVGTPPTTSALGAGSESPGTGEPSQAAASRPPADASSSSSSSSASSSSPAHVHSRQRRRRNNESPRDRIQAFSCALSGAPVVHLDSARVRVGAWTWRTAGLWCLALVALWLLSCFVLVM